MERGSISGFRKMLPLSRDVIQIALGLTISNIGNIINIIIMGVLLSYLIRYPITLSLLPSLASLRGSVAASMASRVSTLLHLGVFKPSYKDILGTEASRTLVLTLFSSLIAAFMVSYTTSFALRNLLFISITSSVLAYAILLPSTAYIAVKVYIRGIDPDNIMTPLVTALGDITTLPLIALATLVTLNLLEDRFGPFIVLLLLYLSISYIVYAWLRDDKNKSVIMDTMPIIIIVAVLESITGALLVEYSEKLLKYGLLHATPAFLSFSGAIISIASAKQATTYHLYGSERVTAEVPRRALEGLISAIIPGLILSFLTSLFIGISRSLLIAGSLIIGIIIMLTLLIPLSSVMTVTLSKAGFDPDNVIIPLATTIVDLIGIPTLLFSAEILDRLGGLLT